MAFTTIDDPSLYFRVKIYSGNDSDGHAITWDETASMSPDFLWLKNRTDSQEHWLCNTVRGTGKFLESNSTAAESSDGASGFASFDSNGFTLNDSARTNRDTMVAWGWKETATAGFDIVTYEGTGSARTVSHSLSAVPHMMHIKNIENTGGSGTEGWLAYHKGIGATKAAGHLNSTGVPHDHTDYFNDVEPTSSVFTVGAGDNGNNSGEDNIAFLFSEKQGFSKISSFKGNGNADGPFIYCGFRPAMILAKNTGRAEDWFILDNKRDAYNPVDERLQPNTTGTESTVTSLGIDFCANGFKLKGATNQYNADGELVIFMAFAEAPFVTSNGVPANAR